MRCGDPAGRRRTLPVRSRCSMLRAAALAAGLRPRLGRLMSAATTQAVPAPNQQPEVFYNQVRPPARALFSPGHKRPGWEGSGPLGASVYPGGAPKMGCVSLYARLPAGILTPSPPDSPCSIYPALPLAACWSSAAIRFPAPALGGSSPSDRPLLSVLLVTAVSARFSAGHPPEGVSIEVVPLQEFVFSLVISFIP